jgi:aspartate/methionine/tyrosine aminotransferase
MLDENNTSKKEVTAGFMGYFSIIESLKEQVIKNGYDYIHLGKGDFDHSVYKVPYIAKSVLTRALGANYFPYSHPGGKEDTRELIAEVENISRNKGEIYTYKNISLSIGATNAFYSIIDILISNTKKRVITFEPTYISHLEVIQKHKGVPELIDLNGKSEFEIQEEHILQMEKIIKTKGDVAAIVLVNPSFPFGKYIEIEILERMLEIAEKNKVFLVIDEAYSSINLKKMSYNKRTLLNNSPYLIKIRTFSKKLTLSGIRLGYIISSALIANKVATLNEYSIGCPPTWLEPLIDLHSFSILEEEDMDKYKKSLKKYSLKKMKIIEPFIQDLGEISYYKKKINKDLLNASIITMKELDMYKELSYIKPEAGINMGISINKKTDDFTLMKDIFLNTGVVLTPGSIFSVKESIPWFRMTFANDINDIKTGMRLLGKYIQLYDD